MCPVIWDALEYQNHLYRADKIRPKADTYALNLSCRSRVTRLGFSLDE